MTDEQIQDVINRMDRKDCKVFRIQYINDIFDDINDFIKDLRDTVKQENIYNKLLSDIYDSDQSNDDKIAAYEQLDEDKNNYYLMCLRNDIPFHLNNDTKGEYLINDFTANVDIGDNTILTFSSPYNYYEGYYKISEQFARGALKPNVTTITTGGSSSAQAAVDSRRATSHRTH
ncbi:hypothetical protein M9Y10_041441, partial [Tritrichomonas musculus]